MKASSLLVGVVVLGGAAAAVWYFARGGTVTVTLTQAELEQQLGKRFPLRKTYLQVLEVVYENPRVVLTDGSDRIGIGVDARADLPLTDRDPKGSADIVTKLAYDAEQKAFVLHEPKVERIALDGLGEHAERVKELANLLAVEQLPGLPVYTLKPTDAKRTIARAVLKSATVRDGVLVLELGL